VRAVAAAAAVVMQDGWWRLRFRRCEHSIATALLAQASVLWRVD